MRQTPRVLAALGWLTLAVSLSGQQPSPLFGVWRLNPARSSPGSSPALVKRTTCTIEPREDGNAKDGVRVAYDMVGVRGGITHVEWTGKFDGRDYPVQGLGYVLTNAYRRIDERTYEVVQKVDGELAAASTLTVSTDGKTITTTTAGRDPRGQDLVTTSVYEKQ